MENRLGLESVCITFDSPKEALPLHAVDLQYLEAACLRMLHKRRPVTRIRETGIL